MNHQYVAGTEHLFHMTCVTKSPRLRLYGRASNGNLGAILNFVISKRHVDYALPVSAQAGPPKRTINIFIQSVKFSPMEKLSLATI